MNLTSIKPSLTFSSEEFDASKSVKSSNIVDPQARTDGAAAYYFLTRLLSGILSCRLEVVPQVCYSNCGFLTRSRNTRTTIPRGMTYERSGSKSHPKLMNGVSLDIKIPGNSRNCRLGPQPVIGFITLRGT